jgi:predicted component of type VI protein secretion system
MIQLRVLTGKQAGVSWTARHFPVRLGRSADCDLRLEDDGIWDKHATIRLEGRAFVVEPATDASLLINSEPVHGATALRNGDTISAGAANLRFWLGESRQANIDWREPMTWIGIAAVSLGQVGLIYWLIAAAH